MNSETFPSSSCTPIDDLTLGEDKEKTSCDVSGVRTGPSSPTPQDPADDSAAQASQTSSLRSRRRRRRNKCLEQFKKMSKSMTLENSGSVARDHLASERTFLAYVRTSIGCSTMGVALVQLFSLTATNSTPKIRRVGNVLGAIVVMVGMAVLIMGSTRYFHVQKSLVDGKYMTAGYVVLFIALVISAVIVVMFGVLVGVAVIQ